MCLTQIDPLHILKVMKADEFISQKPTRLVSCAVLELDKSADQKSASRVLPV